MRSIEYKGETFPCYVTMGAMVRFKRETGRDISTMDGDITDMVIFLWCCVCAACNAEGVVFDVPFELFADSLTPEMLNSFTEGIAASGDAQKKTEATPAT